MKGLVLLRLIATGTLNGNRFPSCGSTIQAAVLLCNHIIGKGGVQTCHQYLADTIALLTYIQGRCWDYIFLQAAGSCLR